MLLIFLARRLSAVLSTYSSTADGEKHAKTKAPARSRATYCISLVGMSPSKFLSHLAQSYKALSASIPIRWKHSARKHAAWQCYVTVSKKMVKIATWQADDTCHAALNPSQVHEKKFPSKHRIAISICQLQDQQVPRISTLTFFLLAKHSEDILLANISHGNCLSASRVEAKSSLRHGDRCK